MTVYDVMILAIFGGVILGVVLGFLLGLELRWEDRQDAKHYKTLFETTDHQAKFWEEQYNKNKDRS